MPVKYRPLPSLTELIGVPPLNAFKRRGTERSVTPSNDALYDQNKAEHIRADTIPSSQPFTKVSTLHTSRLTAYPPSNTSTTKLPPPPPPPAPARRTSSQPPSSLPMLSSSTLSVTENLTGSFAAEYTRKRRIRDEERRRIAHEISQRTAAASAPTSSVTPIRDENERDDVDDLYGDSAPTFVPVTIDASHSGVFHPMINTSRTLTTLTTPPPTRTALSELNTTNDKVEETVAPTPAQSRKRYIIHSAASALSSTSPPMTSSSLSPTTTLSKGRASKRTRSVSNKKAAELSTSETRITRSSKRRLE